MDSTRFVLAILTLSLTFGCKKTSTDPAPTPAASGAAAVAKGAPSTASPAAAATAAPAASPCSTAASLGSRMQTNGDSCIDYTGPAWTAAQIKDQSSQNGWTQSATACPTANSVGACAYSIPSLPGRETVQRHYVTSGMTAAKAEAYCKGNPAQTGVFCP